MPRVLMISYLFPPMGGVGVQRTLKFVKYLPEFGWNPHVLTSSPPKNGLLDGNLIKEIPESTAITRTRSMTLPQRFPWRLRELFSRWILTIDEQVGWYPFAIRAGRQIIHEARVDVIYSSSSPYTSHLVARRLASETHLPWVADFRDPWLGNSNLRFPTPLHRGINKRLERQVLMDANRVLVISPPMKESFCARYPGVDPGKITWLPNGFDKEDFINVQPVTTDKDRFNLVYTGSFYSQGRTSKPILEALQAAILQGKIPRNKICLCLVGNIGKSTQALITKLDLEDVVEAPGFLPHRQSIAYLMAADALLLIIGNAPDSSAVFTGKLFEYLASGKPILCLANEGVASELMREARAGVVIPPDDIGQISTWLAKMYNQWLDGLLKIEPDTQLIGTFERRCLTEQLAGIYNAISVKSA